MIKYNYIKALDIFEGTLKENNVDYKLFIAEHSGHNGQNDDKIYGYSNILFK